MDPDSELQRLVKNGGLASMPANPWRFDVDLGEAPDEAMRRLTEVVILIGQRSAGSWPSDDEWESSLPAWLLAAIPRLSKQETDKLLAETPRERWDSLPWERLSWLDALRDRGWRWWGWGKQDGVASIVLHIALLPERIDAFRELLRASGIRILSEETALRRETCA